MRRWVPPEAAAAGLRAAKSQGSWLCPACTLINEPRAATCEACNAKRPLQDLGALARTASANGVSKGDQADGTEAGNKKANKKVPKFERLRLTSGGQDPAFQVHISLCLSRQIAGLHSNDSILIISEYFAGRGAKESQRQAGQCMDAEADPDRCTRARPAS